MDWNRIKDKENSLMAPVFTIDLEDWNDALHIDQGNHSSLPVLNYLLDELEKHSICAIIYKLDYIPATKRMIHNHNVQTHGVYHRWWENADRRPYQWLGFTGGFWFRFLPYWFVKRQILKHGMFYCHLHDFDEKHPKLKNPFLNWKRHVGLKKARAKLTRLLDEVKFE